MLLAVDASGYAIVVGSFYQSVSLGGTTVTGYLDNMAGFAWKLDSSGTTDWAVAVGEVGTGNSSSSGSSGLTGVAVDGSGNVYAAGEISAPGEFYFGSEELDASEYEGVVWKLNSSGSSDWALPSAASETSSLVGVAVDGSGEAYTAGDFAGSAVLGGVYLTPAGDFVWPLNASSLTSQSETYYDNLGQLYQTETDSVDPNTGLIDGSLTSNSYYDANGNVIEQTQPNGAVTKDVHDGRQELVLAFVSLTKFPVSPHDKRHVEETRVQFGLPALRDVWCEGVDVFRSVSMVRPRQVVDPLIDLMRASRRTAQHSRLPS